MRVTFRNPINRINTADLSKEQFFKLMSMSGYTIVDFEGELPVVESTLRIHRKEFSECESCSA